MNNIQQKNITRVMLGCSIIMIGCIIGLWQYTQKELSKKNTSVDLYEQHEKIIDNNEPDSIEENLKIRNGDNFLGLLKRASFKLEQSRNIIHALKKVFNPRDLRTDHEILVTYMLDNKTKEKNLLSIIIKLSIDTEILVKLTQEKTFHAEKIKKELVHEVRYASGNINDSLYVDAAKQGAHPKVLHQMIQAFSYDIDFQRSFQKGDTYSLLFDYDKEHETGQEKPGNLIYAKLTLQGKKVEIYRFTPKKGMAQYFKSNGEYVKKGLLRTPIDGARITSRFGRRKHPVLGYTAMHKGVDFAAPVGTPIRSSGSGKIARIGRWGAYGNYIRVRHNNRYSTAYAHLRRFARGLKKGHPVRQGQIIGYLGATGRVTGAHLHYEVLLNGKQINPSKIKMLPSRKLKNQELQRFLVAKSAIEKQLLEITSENNLTKKK